MLHRADLRRVDKRREPLPAGKVYHHHVWRGYQYDSYSRCICCGYSCRFGSGWYYSRIKAGGRKRPPAGRTSPRRAGRGLLVGGRKFPVLLREVVGIVTKSTVPMDTATF